MSTTTYSPLTLMEVLLLNLKKKKYGAYLQLWIKKYGELVNSYYESLFVGHCTAENLVEHILEFEKSVKLNTSFLLHLGTDGLSVNKSFENRLVNELRDQDIHILNLGSCCLRKVQNAFRNALKQLHCDFDQFVIDMYPFSNYLMQGERIICLWTRFEYIP